MNGRNPIDIVFLLPLEGPSRNLESLADRRIPINSPRVYQRSAMVGERTEGIAKQLQDPGNPALMFPDRRRPKGESAACDRPGVSGSGPRSFIPARSGRPRIFS